MNTPKSYPRIPGFLLVLILFSIAFTHTNLAGNWPSWKGPKGNGMSNESQLPVKWTKESNIAWRVPLAEPGNSSPIVWGDHVFITQQDTKNGRAILICFDREDGRQLWQSGVEIDGKERTHRTNPYASASPVTDGERIICWFGSGGLVAYDFSGTELWRKDLGQHDHAFGYGGSPVILGDRVLLNFGPGSREFFVALNKKTGEELWRYQSPTPAQDDILGTWSTPLIVSEQDRDIVISALRNDLAALDPASGRVLWRTPAFGPQAKSSPSIGEGIVVMSGDKESSEIAVRMGGTGDVSDSHVLWTRNPAKRRIATGIVKDGHIFGVQTIGIADCVELKTGKVVWEERLRGSGGNNAVWASPVLAGDILYVTNQSGDVFAWRASTDKFELLAVNSMGEVSNSTLAISDGHLFLRTHEALWCIGGD